MFPCTILYQSITNSSSYYFFFLLDLPAYKGEVPDEDVHESNAKGPDAPNAPPISSMDRVAGYESVNMQGGM